ncbi:MAG: hypothetical protein ACRC1M_05365 [Methanobacteriaceae archaeon]
MILNDIRNNVNIEISDTVHFILRSNTYEHCNYELSYELLKNHIPFSIDYSEKDKFKIRFLHPSNEKYFIVIVVFIASKKSIRLITTHPEKR